MGLSLKSNYEKKNVSCFDTRKVPRSPGKWNWNWLYFLPFIFTFEQGDLSVFLVYKNKYRNQIFLFTYRGRNILDDFREAYRWLSQNTAYNATVMSWWDYGYQIAGMANRTTLVDNNTWNNSHIALVSFSLDDFGPQRIWDLVIINMRPQSVSKTIRIF